MCRDRQSKILLLFVCILLGCASAMGRSFIDVSYDQANEDYDISYHLNALGRLQIAKFCVPISSPLGNLESVGFRYEGKFTTEAGSFHKGEIYSEYLVSFDVENSYPMIALIALYQKGSNKTELRIRFDDFGGSNWSNFMESPVAEFSCENESQQ